MSGENNGLPEGLGEPRATDDPERADFTPVAEEFDTQPTLEQIEEAPHTGMSTDEAGTRWRDGPPSDELSEEAA